MRASGYTLVEVIIAVGLLAVLAASALPLVAPVDENRIDAAAQEIANALRFARGEALRTGAYHGVDFSVDPGTSLRRIRVFRTDSASPPNPVYDVRHPLDKKLYDIRLESGPGTQGVVISHAEFLYYKPLFTWVTLDWVAFDATGMPEYYPDAANYTLVVNLLNPVPLTVAVGGKSRGVSLHTTTGRVTVP